MALKSILKQLDIFAECKRFGLPLWQCPSFLFVMMGLIIIAAILITYYVGIHYIVLEVLLMILIIATVVLLIIGHTIVSSFERVAQANRMKSEFVSIVSHQLRTPLSSLKWSLGLLRGKRLGELNEKQREYFDIISESNNRMIGLVNDLLNVNRIEQGRLEARPEIFSLESLVGEIINEIESLAAQNDATIKFYKEKDLPLVYADPNRIRMVVQNLIENAIKYSRIEEKNKLAEIILKGNKDKVMFIIKDNGVGIPFSLQKQVFGKFFRGDSLVKQKVEGAGLGLFIAKGIIDLSKGEINFKSKEGKGSEFWFTLPTKK